MFQTEVVEKIKTYILCSATFFPPTENRFVYEKMWKNMVQPDRQQMTVWHTRVACWITKAVDAHSEHVILIAFPQQQWLFERASMLRLYVHFLSRHDVTPYNPVDV